MKVLFFYIQRLIFNFIKIFLLKKGLGAMAEPKTIYQVIKNIANIII